MAALPPPPAPTPAGGQLAQLFVAVCKVAAVPKSALPGSPAPTYDRFGVLCSATEPTTLAGLGGGGCRSAGFVVAPRALAHPPLRYLCAHAPPPPPTRLVAPRPPGPRPHPLVRTASCCLAGSPRPPPPPPPPPAVPPPVVASALPYARLLPTDYLPRAVSTREAGCARAQRARGSGIKRCSWGRVDAPPAARVPLLGHQRAHEHWAEPQRARLRRRSCCAEPVACCDRGVHWAPPLAQCSTPPSRCTTPRDPSAPPGEPHALSSSTRCTAQLATPWPTAPRPAAAHHARGSGGSQGAGSVARAGGWHHRPPREQQQRGRL